MNERKKQSEFLKSLLACQDCPEHRDLHDRLLRAERDEQCMRRACRLVVVVTFMALAVLGYFTVLEVSNSMSRLAAVALRFAQVIALGSAMASTVFIGLLFWQRALISRLHADGRKLVTANLQNRHPSPAPASTVIVHEGGGSAYQARTDAQSSGPAETIVLPKAS